MFMHRYLLASLVFTLVPIKTYAGSISIPTGELSCIVTDYALKESYPQSKCTFTDTNTVNVKAGKFYISSSATYSGTVYSLFYRTAVLKGVFPDTLSTNETYFAAPERIGLDIFQQYRWAISIGGQ
ncbi:hypothetical protein D5018_19935 [Parashewanella curva]|uniref:Uncharacterized protein n=1 Tax=Parashewanella curva TaxID=2338552 RepID=A0A3L8PRC7_9GAMM|nr:hypothetical protein [Parashewanella curva]RLV57926.1 hypothetical protein D5018_19935 [Parashewanella curva]